MIQDSHCSMVWYCARTKPRQERVAAANVRKSLGLDVFCPRFHCKRTTHRGVVRKMEPLFPCYLFIHARLGVGLDDIRYTSGIISLVHFGRIIPTVQDSVIAELKKHFETGESIVPKEQISAGGEVRRTNQAFSHLNGTILRSLPARTRAQVLLEILGRPTTVEIDQHALLREKCSMAALLPSLAA